MSLPNTAYFVDGPRAGELLALEETPPPFLRFVKAPTISYEDVGDINDVIVYETITYVRDRRDFQNGAVRYVLQQ